MLAASMAEDVLFVCDPPERFDPRADSTFVMITEALRRGHRPFAALLPDLGLRGPQAWANAAPLGLSGDVIVRGPAEPRALDDFGCVLMRKDPPVDAGYLAATWILDHTRTLVLNGPRGLRELNEKLAITRFSDLVPRTFVTRDGAEVGRALAELGGRAIAKPVYGFGGRDVLLLRDGDPNLGSLVELATADGTRWSVIQEYLPEAVQGDKRILLVDGEPIGAVLRVPAAGELRNNFHAGGSPAKGEVDDRDRAICSRLAPVLRALDQFFVGIDVIGGRLTEINVTSPTGMQECNRLHGLAGDQTMQARFWTALESKLGERRGS
jgi:glutathione synthase